VTGSDTLLSGGSPDRMSPRRLVTNGIPERKSNVSTVAVTTRRAAVDMPACQAGIERDRRRPVGEPGTDYGDGVCHAPRVKRRPSSESSEVLGISEKRKDQESWSPGRRQDPRTDASSRSGRRPEQQLGCRVPQLPATRSSRRLAWHQSHRWDDPAESLGCSHETRATGHARGESLESSMPEHAHHQPTSAAWTVDDRLRAVTSETAR